MRTQSTEKYNHVPGKMEYFEKITKFVSRWLYRIAIGAMFLMLITVVADVAGAKIFRLPLLGAMELACILGLLISALAIPFIYSLGGHIKIEFFMVKFSRRPRKIVACAASVLSLALFSVMTWQMISFSHTMQVSGVITPSIRIPVFPFAYAVAFSFLITCLLILLDFLQTVREVFRK